MTWCIHPDVSAQIWRKIEDQRAVLIGVAMGNKTRFSLELARSFFPRSVWHLDIPGKVSFFLHDLCRSFDVISVKWTFDFRKTITE